MVDIFIFHFFLSSPICEVTRERSSTASATWQRKSAHKNGTWSPRRASSCPSPTAGQRTSSSTSPGRCWGESVRSWNTATACRRQCACFVNNTGLLPHRRRRRQGEWALTPYQIWWDLSDVYFFGGFFFVCVHATCFVERDGLTYNRCKSDFFLPTLPQDLQFFCGEILNMTWFTMTAS